MFKAAVKRESKLRLCIAGPSGSGKTFSALGIASGIGSRIALVDTENGSASLYADAFEFDVVNYQPPYNPERFIEAIDVAEELGYDVLILDSLSHEYHGRGGILDIVDEAKPRFGGNDWAAWSEGTPRHRDLIDRIVASNLHIIATVRTKTKWLQVKENGKKKPVKVGTDFLQRPQFEYDWTVVMMMDWTHTANIDKQRLGLEEKPYPHPGPEMGQLMLRLLEGKPLPTQDELTEDALNAEDLHSFVWAAYDLEGVSEVLESRDRLKDWYQYVVGEFRPDLNAATLAALRQYISNVLDGAKIRDAVGVARQTVLDVKNGDVDARAVEEAVKVTSGGDEEE